MNRNILNTTEVENLVEDLCRHARCVEIREWIRTTVRKWILKKHDDLLELQMSPDGGAVCLDHDGSVYDSYGSFSLPTWSIQALCEGTAVHLVRLDRELYNRVHQTIDYLNARQHLGEIRRLNRLSFEQAEEATQVWHAHLGKLGRTDDDGDVQTIVDFNDGYRVVQLLSEAALRREGAMMGHCVGSYHAYLNNNFEILSLRDEKNVPHCTMEVRDLTHLTQIKGKANQPLRQKYAGYVRQFIRDLGYKVTGDGENIGLYQLMGRYYDDINEFVRSHPWKADEVTAWIFGDTIAAADTQDALRHLQRAAHKLTDQSRRMLHQQICPENYDYRLQVKHFDLCGEEFRLCALRYPINYLLMGESGCFVEEDRRRSRRVVETAAEALYTFLLGDDTCFLILGDIARHKRHRFRTNYLNWTENDPIESLSLPIAHHAPNAQLFLDRTTLDYRGAAKVHRQRLLSRLGGVRKQKKSILRNTHTFEGARWRSTDQALQALAQSKHIW